MSLQLLSIAEIDEHLSHGMFGNSQNLRENTASLYDGIIIALSQFLKIELPPLSSVTSPTKRSVYRREIDAAFAEIEQNALVESARSRLDKFISSKTEDHHKTHSHCTTGPMSYLSDWQDDCYAGDIRQTFSRSMRDEGASIFGVTPTPDQLKKTRIAHEVGCEVFPKTYVGTLQMAPSVIIVQGGISSAYINENPEAYFINSTQFADSLLLAESLFHEALHEKMATIRLTTNLLAVDYDDYSSEENGDVLVPWPDIAAPRKWSFARALAAYHVYVHTSAYYVGCLVKGIECSNNVDVQTRIKTQVSRAIYLDKALTSERCMKFADSDGLNFFDWTTTVLNSIPKIVENHTSEKFDVQKWDLDRVRQAA